MQDYRTEQDELADLVQKHGDLLRERKVLEEAPARAQKVIDQANAQLDEQRRELQRVREKLDEINKAWNKVLQCFVTQFTPDEVPEEVLMALEERRRLDLADPHTERRHVMRMIFKARQQIKAATKQLEGFEQQLINVKEEREQVLADIFRLM